MQGKKLLGSALIFAGVIALVGIVLAHQGTVQHAAAASGCADVDGSGAVGAMDVILVSDYYFDPAAPPQVDLNKDGVVNLADDIFSVIIELGQVTSCQTAPLPKTEPAGGALAVDAVGESTSTSDTIQTTRSEDGGVPFTVSVHVSSNPNSIDGFSARLHWDEALLDLVDDGTSLWTDRAKGFDFNLSNNSDDGIGNEAYGEVSGTTLFPTDPGWSGTGPVAQFVFVCQFTGTANLTLTDAGSHSALYGRPGIEYTPALANAQINCLSNAPTATPKPTATPTPTPTPCPSPCLALTPTPTVFQKVALTSGNVHSCALNDHGGVQCWGANGPEAVEGLGTGVVAVSSGANHNCALTTAGGVLCWGSDTVGQVGNGNACGIECETPVGVTGLSSGVVAIAAGGLHSCAITTSGGLKCWGYNIEGQLGDGTTTIRDTPVDVVGLSSNVASVALGGHHTCALLVSGGVKCWGSNDEGQVGDGTTTDRHTPTNVTGLSSGVAAVSKGIFHTCGLTVTGGLKCWGGNSFGQLGIGNTGDRSTPADVVGLSSGVAVVGAARNGQHTCAISTGGALKCWGRNDWGQVGDGTTTNRTTPVSVVGLDAGVAAVAGGGWHTCALQWGGAKCWGQNQYGQLGFDPGLEPWECEPQISSCSSTTPLDIDKGFPPTPTPTPCDGPCPTPTDTPTATATPTNTPLPTATPTYDPTDTDGDGCTDQRENGPDEMLGGMRDWQNPYDFYDVLGGGGGPRDQIIDLSNDIFGVIIHYAPTGTEPEYDVNFDRGPSTGPDTWNMTAPDGVIDLTNDILGVIQQYLHSCQ